MPDQFSSPEGDIENYFVSEYWLIDQYIGDQLWTWGLGSFGRLGTNDTTSRSTPSTTFSGGTNWKQVSCSRDSTAAIKTDGTLWVWGYNDSRKLGTNDLTDRSTPVTTFAGGTDWKQVSVSAFNMAAVKTDGTLWTWGYNGRGQLGNGITTSNISTPVTTSTGGTNWKQVSVGYYHTAALKTDGTLWTWGDYFSELGMLGKGDYFSTRRDKPSSIFQATTNWADTATTEPEDLYTISAGYGFSSAIKTDGTLWTWGNGDSGALGNAVTTGNISTPVTTFAGGTDWKQVSGGTSHTSAIKTDGTLWTWGFGNQGRLGNANITDRSTPVTTFAGGTNWKQVSVSAFNASAIKTDGTLWTWGFGSNGRLGNGGNAFGVVSTPVTTFAGGTNWKQSLTIFSATFAIKTDGTLWSWGSGNYGQLGNGITTGNISTPITTFAGGSNWKQIGGGANTGTPVAVKTDGTLWTWGLGGSGRLGNGITTGNISTPITTFAGGTNWKQVTNGRDSTLAIKTDGTLWTWGVGSRGQLGNGVQRTTTSTPVTTFAGGTDWKQVSGGFDHNIALKGTSPNLQIFSFGSAKFGEMGDGFNIQTNYAPGQVFGNSTNWKKVSAGYHNTASIKTDGTLWTWGYNYGNLGVADLNNRNTPVTTFAGGTNWKQVITGGYYDEYMRMFAIKTDGTLWSWGSQRGGSLANFVDSTGHVSTPITTFAGGTNWKYVDVGPQTTSAIKTDGTLWTWGNGGSGRLGNSATTIRSTPVTTFAGGTNWKQVGCGGYHIAAVQSGISPDLPLS